MRIDYVDDPNAPAANSVVPSVVAVVVHDGHLLLIPKTDHEKWALPGGGHEIGETIAETVVREMREETGYEVAVDTITRTYTKPHHVMAYDDGEVRQQFSIAFRASLTGGESATSEESDRVRWVPLADIEGLDMHPSMRLRVSDALTSQRPVIR